MASEREEALEQARLQKIRQQLEDAQRLLPSPFSQEVKFALSTVASFLRSEEYEKAWDALIDAGEKHGANASFYERMGQAASTMDLVERRAEALRRAKSAG